MGLEDLRAAFADLKQGVTEVATMSAISDAQNQVQQIRAGITEEAKQRQALQQTANDLTLKLAGLGASGTQINSAFQAIAPPTPQTPDQALLMGQLEGSPFLTQVGQTTRQQIDAAKIPEEERAFKRQKELMMLQTQLRAGAADAGLDKETRKSTLDRFNRFHTENKASIEGLRKITTLKDMMEKGAGDAALVEFGKRVLLKNFGETRITEEDVKAANLNPSLVSAAGRNYAKLIQNEAFQPDKQTLLALLDSIEKRTKQDLTIAAESSATAADAIPGMDRKTLAEKLKSYAGIDASAAQKSAMQKINMIEDASLRRQAEIAAKYPDNPKAQRLLQQLNIDPNDLKGAP